LRNSLTLDTGVLGYIKVILHNKHSAEEWHILPGTPCVNMKIWS